MKQTSAITVVSTWLHSNYMQINYFEIKSLVLNTVSMIFRIKIEFLFTVSLRSHFQSQCTVQYITLLQSLATWQDDTDVCMFWRIAEQPKPECQFLPYLTYSMQVKDGRLMNITTQWGCFIACFSASCPTHLSEHTVQYEHGFIGTAIQMW